MTLACLDPPLRRVPLLPYTAAVQIVRDMADHLSAQHVGVVLNPFDTDNLLCEIGARSGGQAEPGSGIDCDCRGVPAPTVDRFADRFV